MKPVKFTGGLKIVDGVGLVREIDPSHPPYVGPPSPEMDNAWDAIVGRRSSLPIMHQLTRLLTELRSALNIFLTKEELEGDTRGTSPDPETGLYVAMLVWPIESPKRHAVLNLRSRPQGFHDLHCLVSF